MPFIPIIVVRYGNEGNVLHISITSTDAEVTPFRMPLAHTVSAYHHLCSRHPLHGMLRIYPAATGTIAVRDVQFEAKPHTPCLASSQAQVSPPIWAEAILCALCPCVLSMVLVIIDHPAETSIMQGLYICSDAFIASLFIAKEPPRLHPIVRRRIAPQPMHGFRGLCHRSGKNGPHGQKAKERSLQCTRRPDHVLTSSKHPLPALQTQTATEGGDSSRWDSCQGSPDDIPRQHRSSPMEASQQPVAGQNAAARRHIPSR